MSNLLLGKGSYRISSDYIIMYSEAALEYGIPIPALLEGSQLPISIMLKPNVNIGHESFLRIVKNFLDYSGDFWSSLDVARRGTMSKHGILGYSMMLSNTLGEATEKFEKYYPTRFQLFQFDFNSSDESLQFSVSCRAPLPDDSYLQYVSLVCLLCMKFTIDQLISVDDIPTRITLKGPAPSTAKPEHAENFQIDFDAGENCLYLPTFSYDKATFLDLHDASFEEIADQQNEKALATLIGNCNLTEKVRQLLKKNQQDMANMEVVASNLNLSAASLRRKLKSEGTTFQAIKDKERYRLAVGLLANHKLSIVAIAEKLGFSDASNFTKAFKLWAGISPKQLRQYNKQQTRRPS